MNMKTKEYKELEKNYKYALKIIGAMTDSEECWFDHDGNCQAHSCGSLDGVCPHARAKELLLHPKGSQDN